MKTVINKITGEKLYNTMIYDIHLDENEELVDFIQDEITNINEIPTEVQLWKIRVIIKLMGLDLEVENSLKLLEEPNRTAAEYIWNYGTTIDRYSDTVLFIQQNLKLEDNQVDEIFKSANDIKL